MTTLKQIHQVEIWKLASKQNYDIAQESSWLCREFSKYKKKEKSHVLRFIMENEKVKK